MPATTISDLTRCVCRIAWGVVPVDEPGAAWEDARVPSGREPDVWWERNTVGPIATGDNAQAGQT